MTTQGASATRVTDVLGPTDAAAPAGSARNGFPLRFRAALTPPYEVGPGAVAATIDFIERAEAWGYDDVWLADAGGTDPLTLAALALTRTSRIRVGIAVVPAYTRTPVVLAATVATLADIGEGRFALGLGTSSETMLEGWHGLRLDRPVTRMRETVDLLRVILAGGKTEFEGVTLRSVGYRQPAVGQPVPILLAALGPRMTELAATVADGVVLNLLPLAALERVIAGIREHAESAGRPADSIEISSRVPVLVTDDIDAGRDLFRRQFAPYYVNPVYNQFLASCGFADEAEAALEAGRARDWAAARAALSDELVDAVAVIGDAAYCSERIRAFVDAGVTTPILGCTALELDEHRATYEALSPSLCGDRP